MNFAYTYDKIIIKILNYHSSKNYRNLLYLMLLMMLESKKTLHNFKNANI